jgi:hypothetical protein
MVAETGSTKDERAMLKPIAGERSAHGRLRVAARIVLAGVTPVLLSLLVLIGMPLWMPPGAGGIDHLILPLVLLPAVWATLFFHALLDRRLARVGLIALLIAVLNVALLVRHFANSSQPAPAVVERTP